MNGGSGAISIVLYTYRNVALEVFLIFVGQTSFNRHISVSDLNNTLTAQDVDKLSKQCKLLAPLIVLYAAPVVRSSGTHFEERERDQRGTVYAKKETFSGKGAYF